MRKTFNILVSGLLVAATWSCSEDTMDDINKNVNDPTNVSSNLTITDVMTSSAFSVTGSDLAFYASVYIEHNVGIGIKATMLKFAQVSLPVQPPITIHGTLSMETFTI